jgi:DNA-binding CsgD family transcriptional regulator
MRENRNMGKKKNQELTKAGISVRKIAKALQISTRTVLKYK